MKNPKMKEFLRAMGRMQEEDFVTVEEFYKMFNAVIDAVKASAVNNKGKIEEVSKTADKKAKELEKLFAQLLDAVDKRMKAVKDGKDGAPGETPTAGVDYPDYQEIRDFITDQVSDLPKIEDLEESVKSMFNVDYIKAELEALEGNDRLSMDAINGIETFIDEKVRLMEANLRRGPMAITGGGTGSSSSTSGATTFLSLTDTPSSYTANQYVKVNAAGDALELAALAGGGDMTAAVYDAAGITEQLVGLTATQTLTNKTIDADNNTITNIALGAEATGALGDLSDVTETSVANGEVLLYTGAAWENQTLAEASIQGVLAEGAFVDGDKTKLDGIETGADVTDTDNVRAAGALMDDEVTNLADVKAFDPADYATAAQGSTADSALQDVVDDTTPQLGGNLDVQANSITTSVVNGNITIAPNGNGDVVIDGAIDLATNFGEIGISGGTGIYDSNENYLLLFAETASAVNEFEIANAATGNGPELRAVGSDSNISINFIPKGTGEAQVNGEKIIDETDTASDSAAGIVELATTAETNTGTDATRAVTPDALAGSNLGIRYVQVTCFDYTTDTATGDGKGYFHIPAAMNGMNLVEVHAEVITAPTGGAESYMIHNVTQAADMLSTALTIDATETGSDTAATPAVIDTANDDVATNDLIRIDIDTVGSSSAAKGLIVTCGFQLP